MSGSVREGDREHGVVRNFLEEELAALVEECNREVYLSASSFLRPDDGPARRLSLREFEDGLQQFVESSNLDGLVPGELTFWRWYFGIDHLERGVPGWTLDIKRQAVRMIYEKMSERDGLHVIMSGTFVPGATYHFNITDACRFPQYSGEVRSVLYFPYAKSVAIVNDDGSTTSLSGVSDTYTFTWSYAGDGVSHTVHLIVQIGETGAAPSTYLVTSAMCHLEDVRSGQVMSHVGPDGHPGVRIELRTG